MVALAIFLVAIVPASRTGFLPTSLALDEMTYLFPNGNGATTQWTPTNCAAGAHYDCVDDGRDNHDGDGTYLTSAANTVELLDVQDGSFPPTAVFSTIRLYLVARNPVGFPVVLTIQLVSGSKSCPASIDPGDLASLTYKMNVGDCTPIPFLASDIPAMQIRFAQPPTEFDTIRLTSAYVEIVWSNPSVIIPPDPEKYPLAGDVYCTVAWPWDMTARCIAKERMQSGLISIREWWWDGELIKRTEDRHSGLYFNVSLTGWQKNPLIPLNVSHSVTYRAWLFNGQVFETRTTARYDATILWALYGFILMVGAVAAASRSRHREPESKPPKVNREEARTP